MTPPYPSEEDDPILLGELSAFPISPELEPKGFFNWFARKIARFCKKEIGDLPLDLARRAATAKVESLETDNAVKLMEAIANVEVAQSIANKNNAEAHAIRSKAELDAAERLRQMYAESPAELMERLKSTMSELSNHGGSVFVTDKAVLTHEPAQEALPEMAEES